MLIQTNEWSRLWSKEYMEKQGATANKNIASKINAKEKCGEKKNKETANPGNRIRFGFSEKIDFKTTDSISAERTTSRVYGKISRAGKRK